jgi:hypothetical protein
MNRLGYANNAQCATLNEQSSINRQGAVLNAQPALDIWTFDIDIEHWAFGVTH